MAEYGEGNNTKQQADMQRAKPDAPRPRDRDGDETEEVGVLRNILREIEDVEINTDMLDDTLRDARTVLANVLIDGFNLLSDNISAMAKGVAQKSSLKDLEEKKEDRAQTEETNSLLRKILNAGETDLPVVKQGFFSIILGVFGGLAGLALGFVRGLIPGIIDSFLKSPTLNFIFKTLGKILGKGLLAPIAFIFDRLPERVQFTLGFFADLITKKIQKLVSNTIKFFNKSFALIRNSIRTLFGFPAKQLELFTKDGVSARILRVTKAVSGLFAGILGFLLVPFRAVYTLIGNLTKPIKSIIEAFVGKQKGPGMVKGLVATAAKVMNPFFTMFDTAFGAFKSFGYTLGRLFFPLTVILGVIDGIRGAVEGVTNTAENESRLIGGLFGALKGLLVGFIAIPLNLLTKGINFILKKLFGEDNFISNALTSFINEGGFKTKLIEPIVDFVESIIQALYRFFYGIPETIGNIPDQISAFADKIIGFAANIFADAMMLKRNVTNSIAEFFKGLVRSFLPDPQANPLSLEGIAAKLIPDGIYEAVGLDPNTGELLPVSVLPDTPEVVDDQALVTRGTRKQQDITANSVVDQSVRRSTNQSIVIVQGNNSNTANTLKDAFE